MVEGKPIGYMELMEGMADALVVISNDKRVISINSSASKLFDTSPGEASGMRCRDLVNCELCGDPCPLDECLEKKDTIAHFNIRLFGKEGAETPICMHTSPVKDSSGDVVGVVENVRVINHIKALIHDLELAYDKKELEKERIEAILNSISDAVITIDRDWKITSFNRAAEELTGIMASDTVGKFCRDVMGVDLCSGNCPMEQTLKTGKPRTNVDTVVRLKEGKIIPLSVSTALFRDNNGEVLGGVETYRNLEEIEQVVQKRKSRFPYGDIIGKAPSIKKIFDLIDVIKDTDSTVLITGESGVGKELFATAIHDLSSRRKGPFVKVNCAALTETLLESELFGHVKGAFTGAIGDKVGRFEASDGGTVFLDEIGDIPLPIQVKLLRVLQDHEFERVGSSKTKKVDVRVIAATNRDLRKLMREWTFREDLYYRLNVIPIHVPPLRERVDDIPYLGEHILQKLQKRGIDKARGISPDAMKCLMSYPWAGNVRELENLIERAVVCAKEDIITAADLDAEILEYCRKKRKGIYREPCETIDTGREVRQFDEREEILKVLEKSRWNRGQAARELGMDRTTLWRKMKRYGLS
jgi:PAS domain S-box-containing protein